MTLFKKTVYSTLTVVAFTSIASVFAYLFRFLLARNLTVAEYGLFFAIVSLFSFMAILASMGLAHAAPKFIIDFLVKKDLRKVKTVLLYSFFFHLTVSILVFLIIFVFQDTISEQFLGVSDSTILLLMAVWFTTTVFASIFVKLFLGFQKPVLASSVEVSRTIILFFLTLLFFYFNFGVQSPALAYIATSLALFFAYLPVAIRVFPNFFSVKMYKSKKVLSRLIKFGFFMSIASFAWIAITHIDTILITGFLTLEDVGLYQVAVPIASLIIHFIGAVNLVAYPTIAGLFSRKKYGELSSGLTLFYKYIYLLLVPLAAVFFSFSHVLISVFFGEDYLGASTALKILVVGGLFSSLTMFNNIALAATGNPKTVSKTMISLMIINLALNLFLIPLLGIAGGALATTTTFLIGAVVSLIFLRKRADFKIPFAKWTLTFLSGIITIGAVFLFNEYIILPYYAAIAASLAITGTIYLSLIFVFKLTTVAEIKQFLKQLL